MRQRLINVTGDRDIFLHLSPELDKPDENQANEPRQASARTANEPRQALARTVTANEPRQVSAIEPRLAKEAQHDELLRQVDDDLRRLTSSEECFAVHTHVAHCLDGNDPLTFHEAMEFPLKN